MSSRMIPLVLLRLPPPGERSPEFFLCNQYDNLANRLAHYETTGPEIWEQTGGKITHLVVATGTGGTITGTAMFLKEKNRPYRYGPWTLSDPCSPNISAPARPI